MNPFDLTVQATILRAHLRMHSIGMRNSRLPLTQFLTRASKLTGYPYSAHRSKKDVPRAIADLTSLIQFYEDTSPYTEASPQTDVTLLKV